MRDIIRLWVVFEVLTLVFALDLDFLFLLSVSLFSIVLDFSFGVIVRSILCLCALILFFFASIVCFILCGSVCLGQLVSAS